MLQPVSREARCILISGVLPIASMALSKTLSEMILREDEMISEDEVMVAVRMEGERRQWGFRIQGVQIAGRRMVLEERQWTVSFV